MALPARRGHVRSVHGRLRLGGRQYAMRAVTARTIGGNEQPALGERAAMNRVHVELVRVHDRNAVALGQRSVAMTCPAGSWEI